MIKACGKSPDVFAGTNLSIGREKMTCGNESVADWLPFGSFISSNWAGYKGEAVTVKGEKKMILLAKIL